MLDLMHNENKSRHNLSVVCLFSSHFVNLPFSVRFVVCHAVGLGDFGFRSAIGRHTPKLSYKRKSTNSFWHGFVQFAFGGSGGIRTHVPLEAVTAFRVRAVMTTSIRFRIFLRFAQLSKDYVTLLWIYCQIFCSQ